MEGTIEGSAEEVLAEKEFDGAEWLVDGVLEGAAGLDNGLEEDVESFLSELVGVSDLEAALDDRACVCRWDMSSSGVANRCPHGTLSVAQLHTWGWLGEAAGRDGRPERALDDEAVG